MQKFFTGDLVRIADDLGVSMRHFPKAQDAIVLYSYSEKCARSAGTDKIFGVYLIKDKCETSWYEENQLTLIEKDRFDMLPKSNVYRRSYEAKKERERDDG